VDEVHELYEKFKDKVHFLTVYIREAHPQDLWPLGQHVSVLAHKTVEDRIGICSDFVKKNSWKLPTVVDSMQDVFMKEYWCHPERFFAFVDGKMGFKAQPSDAYYPVSDLLNWLNDHFANKKEQ